MACLRFACALIVLIFTLGFTIVADAQSDKAFPTDEEISLLLAQTDRTLQRYKPLLDEQETEIGTSVADEIAKDRQSLSTLEMVMKNLKNRRSAFNGLQGFTFLELTQQPRVPAPYTNILSRLRTSGPPTARRTQESARTSWRKFAPGN